MYRIDELEDALVNALTAAGFAAKPYTLEPGGKDLARETGEKPAALVSYHRCGAAKTATFQLRRGLDFHFHIYVVARNLRSLTASAATRGDAAGAGVYAALDGLRALLAGNRLGLAAQPLLFIEETPVARSANLSAYRQEWQITVME